MSGAQREQLRPIAWAAGAFASGALLHVDRVPLWATAAAAAAITWRMLVASGKLSMPRRLVRTLVTLALLIVVYARFQTFNA